MDIKEHVALRDLTTFHIGGPARFFCAVDSVNDLSEALRFAEQNKVKFLVLGGGSNMLVSDSGFNGLVIQIRIKGFTVLRENDTSITLHIGAGEQWDEVVQRAVANNWWGIENLSHIPGLVGALAVQNVGAYGQEAKEVIVEVEAWDTTSGSAVTLPVAACGFGYRKSIFNTTEKGRYVILAITLRLSKIAEPNLDYQDVKNYFDAQGETSPSIELIRQAIIEIRDKKFPYPREAVDGNSGSFFKGVLVPLDEFDDVLEQVSHHFGDKWAARFEEIGERFNFGDVIKIPAAVLLEMCSLKNAEHGGAKINTPQPAIVLNASGVASADDVLQLFKMARQKVFQTTGLKLVQEPELVGFTDAELKSYFRLE